MFDFPTIQVNGFDDETGHVYTSSNCHSAYEMKRLIVLATQHYRVDTVRVVTKLGVSTYRHIGAGVWKWDLS